MSKDETYNGWKNYETWNVSLWLGNDEGLYLAMGEYVEESKGKSTYRGLMRFLGFSGSMTTPDRVRWLSSKLDYARLDEMVRENVEGF